MKANFKVGDLIGYKNGGFGSRYCVINEIIPDSEGLCLKGNWRDSKEQALHVERENNGSMYDHEITFHKPAIVSNWRKELE